MKKILRLKKKRLMKKFNLWKTLKQWRKTIMEDFHPLLKSSVTEIIKKECPLKI
jgi:hypothetical protein